jgi:hypothetical protein
MFGSEPHITTLCLSCVVQFSRRRGGLSPPRALGTSRLVGLPGKKGDRVESCPRNASERGAPVGRISAQMDRLLNWKLMRASAIWFTRNRIGCIRVFIRAVKTEMSG